MIRLNKVLSNAQAEVKHHVCLSALADPHQEFHDLSDHQWKSNNLNQVKYVHYLKLIMLQRKSMQQVKHKDLRPIHNEN
mgnify:CR=1 FL=1